MNITSKSKKAIDSMSFEEALAELQELIHAIDSGNETLDNCIAAFERGSELKALCQKKLDEAKLKIQKISQNTKGEIDIQDLDFQ